MAISKPLISVVIPTFNCARYISEAIDSCLKQEYDNLEIIVVNDGSTDDTNSVLKSFENRIIVKETVNLGLGNARNIGMKLAKGKYIAWIDADDICHPKRMLIQAAYLDFNQHVDIVCTGFSAFNENGVIADSYAPTYYSMLKRKGALNDLFSNCDKFNGNNVSWLTTPLEKKYTIYWGKIWEKIVWGNFIHPPTLMFRRSVYESNEELNSEFRTIVDWEYFTRIFKKHNVAYIDESLLKYRRHENQATGGSDEKSIKLAVDILRVFLEILKRNPELRQRYRNKSNIIIAKCYSRVAYAVADSDRKSAIAYLFKGILFNPFQLQNLKCCYRILIPSRIRKMIKK